MRYCTLYKQFLFFNIFNKHARIGRFEYQAHVIVVFKVLSQTYFFPLFFPFLFAFEFPFRFLFSSFFIVIPAAYHKNENFRSRTNGEWQSVLQSTDGTGLKKKWREDVWCIRRVHCYNATINHRVEGNEKRENTKIRVTSVALCLICALSHVLSRPISYVESTYNIWIHSVDIHIKIALQMLWVVAEIRFRIFVWFKIMIITLIS